MIPPGLERALPLLACPVCAGPLSVREASLRCPAGHNFDTSRQGYVNLLRAAPSGDYDRPMLESRRRAARAGLWDGALDAAASLAARHYPGGPVLDAGCGEGSILAAFLPRLGGGAAALGLDISRDAVRLAACAFRELGWAAGDLSRPPLAQGAFGAVLNFLSPARYDAFGRLLAPGGVLIKAVPGADYLRELREAFFDGERRAYSSERVTARFTERFEPVGEQEVRYRFHTGGGLMAALVDMTPLSWSADPERRRAAEEADGADVTVHLRLLAGRPR